MYALVDLNRHCGESVHRQMSRRGPSKEKNLSITFQQPLFPTPCYLVKTCVSYNIYMDHVLDLKTGETFLRTRGSSGVDVQV